MNELLRMLRVLGPRRLVSLFRGYRVGWEGTIRGFYITRTMQALLNVGFFDEIQKEGSVDLSSFAESRDLDATILRALCDSLYALRILDKDNGRYVIDSKGEVLTRVARGWFEGVYGYEGVFHSLEALLRKEKVYGQDVSKRPGCVATGSGEMQDWMYNPLAVDIIQANRYETVLDLGCGDGRFLQTLCETTDATGYGIDVVPQVISDGREKIKQAGLQSNIQLMVQDINDLEKLPDEWRNVDVATCFFVLHEILFTGSENLINLLRKFRTLLSDTSLIVFEFVRPSPDELRKRPGMAVHYILHHDLTHQELIGLEEWKELFRAAGFGSIDERYSSFARTAIFVLD